MTTLTLAKLAEIEAAAATNGQGLWSHIDADPCPLCTFLALCDPATVAALCNAYRERDALAALLREAQDWLNTDVCLDAEGVSLYNRIDAALAKENNNG